MKEDHFLFLTVLSILTLASCSTGLNSHGPYFGNGVHNGWADQHSAVIWTRLTKNAEGNWSGTPFTEITNDQHEALRKITNRDSLHTAQIATGLSLIDMEGACPGAAGEVKLTYHPDHQPQNEVEIDWTPVNVGKNYTLQWHLRDLKPSTNYNLVLEARGIGQSTPSDTVVGSFKTPPDITYTGDVRFCVVTCHDYIRRDDLARGHKIYPAMEKLLPDFYVHTGDIEYYDKPNPYAMTEELMRFKWDRLFALPYQRKFWAHHTTYFMKDDHDVLSDDAYPGMMYGMVSFERGLEIFDHEQFPSNVLPYKTVRWGKDLQIWMVEGRNYRSRNTDMDGPQKTIWGDTQKKWLVNTMTNSDATYKVLFSSSPILGPDRRQKRDNYSNENFRYEGDEIRAFLNQQKNLYICVGDRHWQYVTHPEGTNLWEFSAGPGSDAHAGGWNQEEVRPEHRFLRVKGGFLFCEIKNSGDIPVLIFQHYDVKGNKVYEEVFKTDPN